MQKKCISAVLWQNPIKHESIIHPYVFNSFYRTVTLGESHRIIYKEILRSMFTPFFSIWIYLPTEILPKQVHMQVQVQFQGTTTLPPTPYQPKQLQ